MASEQSAFSGLTAGKSLFDRAIPVHFNDYVAFDALGLADLVRRRAVSPAEVLATSVRAADVLDPLVNALVKPRPLEPSPAAGSGDGRFAGVPFLVKDLLLLRRGRPMEMGSRLTAGYVATETSYLAHLFDGLGFVTWGRTATPEFGHGPTTESLVNGPTRNPWNLDRMAGGSSGGAAAAVASGIVPIAHGGDAAGSIRTPAACCGLVGLKPSRGRVSTGPGTADSLFGMGADFALTRSVRDTAALLDGIGTPMPGDPYVIRQEREEYATLIGRPPGTLRIGFTTTPWYDAPIDRQVVEAVERAARECVGLGHIVEEASPRFDYPTLRSACITLWAAGLSRLAHGFATGLGRVVGADTLEAATLAMVRHGALVTGDQILAALDRVNSVNRAVGPFFAEYDVLITPATARPAEPIGSYDQNAPVTGPEQWFDRKALFPPFAALFNVTGQPAISLPLATSSDGLPIGVQFVAGSGREDLLLQLAAQFEQALPWEARLIARQNALHKAAVSTIKAA